MRKIKVVVLLVEQLQHGFTKNDKVSPNLTVARIVRAVEWPPSLGARLQVPRLRLKHRSSITPAQLLIKVTIMPKCSYTHQLHTCATLQYIS